MPRFEAPAFLRAFRDGSGTSPPAPPDASAAASVPVSSGPTSVDSATSNTATTATERQVAASPSSSGVPHAGSSPMPSPVSTTAGRFFGFFRAPRIASAALTGASATTATAATPTQPLTGTPPVDAPVVGDAHESGGVPLPDSDEVFATGPLPSGASAATDENRTSPVQSEHFMAPAPALASVGASVAPDDGDASSVPSNADAASLSVNSHPSARSHVPFPLGPIEC